MTFTSHDVQVGPWGVSKIFNGSWAATFRGSVVDFCDTKEDAFICLLEFKSMPSDRELPSGCVCNAAVNSLD